MEDISCALICFRFVVIENYNFFCEICCVVLMLMQSSRIYENTYYLKLFMLSNAQYPIMNSA
ncbi:hypothetical protein T08_9244 [Trichinella sp. T8]|nr:hypothetical protein T08_9244 [Trichinella sp. T8]